MPSFQVTRWRRFGHDRLYVNDPTGAAVGWVDLRTGERRLLQPALAAQFEAALAGRLRPVDALAAGQPGFQSWTLPNPPSHASLWRGGGRAGPGDLAANRPGQAVLERAAEERAKAPILTFLARLLGLRTQERAWRVGGRGERMVARRLDALGGEWRVLHSVRVGRGDIDHLAIGPGGVFTLNAKHHPGGSVWAAHETVLVNGQRYPYIQRSRLEAYRASRCLSASAGFPVPAVGLVVVAGARGVTVRAQPRDGRVAVLSDRQLPRWLRQQNHSLTVAQVERLHACARRPGTWESRWT